MLLPARSVWSDKLGCVHSEAGPSHRHLAPCTCFSLSLPTHGGFADVLHHGAVLPGLAWTTGAGRTCSPHLPFPSRSALVSGTYVRYVSLRPCTSPFQRLWDPETGAACPRCSRSHFRPLPGPCDAPGCRASSGPGGVLRGTGPRPLQHSPSSPSRPRPSVLTSLLSTVWQVAPSCLVLMSRNASRVSCSIAVVVDRVSGCFPRWFVRRPKLTSDVSSCTCCHRTLV